MIFAVFFRKKKIHKSHPKKKKGNLNVRLGSTFFAENTIDKNKS